MKKYLYQMLSLLLALCLLAGSVFPIPKVFGQLTDSQTDGSELIPNEGTEPTTGEEEPDPSEGESQFPSEGEGEIQPGDSAVEPVTIQGIQREHEMWAQQISYTITLGGDPSLIESVFLLTADGDLLLTTAENGSYSATISLNGSYTVSVTDKDAQIITMTFEETMIDLTAPVIEEQPSEMAGQWQTERPYTFLIADEHSGIATVTVQPQNEEISTLAPAGDNTYAFIADANIIYTVTATDTAGNSTSFIVTEAYIDREAPTISDINRESDGWRQQAAYTFFVMDTGSGVASVDVSSPDGDQSLEILPTGEYRFTAELNGSYTITTTDLLGNTCTATISETNIDRTPPEITNIQPQQTWDSDTNSASMTISDNGSLDTIVITDEYGQNYTYSQNGAAYAVTIPKNGIYTVAATDKAGNTTSKIFIVDHIDNTAPSKPKLSAFGTGAWVNVDIDLSASSDDAQSGIAAYWYTTENIPFDPDIWQKMELLNGIGLLQLTHDQVETYYVIAEDNVGRISEISNIHVAIDKTPSDSLTAEYVQGENSGFLRNVNGRLLFVDLLTFTAKADDTSSGIVRYEYRVVGASGGDTGWISVDADNNGFTRTFRGAEDIYTVCVRVYDRAGNCSAEYVTEGCILENTHTEDTDRNPAPTVQMEGSAGNYNGSWTNDTVTISVSGSKAVSGIEYYEYRIDFSNPSIADTVWAKIPVVQGAALLTIDKDTNATYHFRAISYAGNISLETSRIVCVQKTAPAAATLTQDAATGTNGWYTVLPDYRVTLPVQNSYFAPVEYIITCTHNGESVGQITYDGTNAPQITEDGTWSFQITARDAAGNTANVTASTVKFSVDTEAPNTLDVTMDGTSILNISDSDNEWDNVNVLDRVLHSDFTIFKDYAVTITASALGGDSGLSAIYYQVVSQREYYDQDGTWKLLSADGLRLTPDGKYHLYFKAVDVAGNITYFSGESLILDDTIAETTVIFAEANLSKHGFYSGDVIVDIRIEDPAQGETNAFSGIKEINYHVLCNGEPSQYGQIWPGSGSITSREGRSAIWDGQIIIAGNSNNSNDVILEITVIDMAGNVTTYSSAEGDIKIDITAPEISGSYDRNNIVTTFQGIGSFTGSRTLMIAVTELNFISEESFVRVVDSDTEREEIYQWISDGLIHTVTIPVTQDGHYTVTASITDAAGNTAEQIVFAEETVAADAFIIDNTPAEIEVSYSNNDALNGIYFGALRDLTVTVTERNFDPAKISAIIGIEREDGSESTETLSNWYSDGSIHTATIRLEDNGVYHLEVTGQDALGNSAKDTVYTGSAPQHWILDTYMDAPVFDYVVDGEAYNGTIVPQITVLDANIDNISVTLHRTRMYEIDADVTDLLITEDKLVYQDIIGGKMVYLDIFPLEDGMDGQYTLTVNCTDKAGNTATNTVTFYANRFGSVYVYDDYLTSLLNGYFYKIEEDIIITEINPSGVVEGSALVQITVDGIPVTAPVFTETPVANGEPGESGWYEYRYVISKDNFTRDGVYNIVISSKDTAGNVPENTDQDQAIRFSVDTTAPELPRISGLENAIVKADSITVTLSAMDNVLLESITVYLDGEILENWTGINSYSVEKFFTIPAGLEHSVRIKVVDKTGNTLDTDSEMFTPGYGFNRTITVSTNFFLRLYANHTMFYLAVGATATVLVGGTILLIVLLKKRKRKAANA